MQITLSKLTSPVRSLAAGTWLALFTALTLCLGASNAMAVTQPPPIVVTGPTVVIGDLTFNSASGGYPSGQAPLGGTFAVGPNGDVIAGDGYGGCAVCGGASSTITPPSGRLDSLCSIAPKLPVTDSHCRCSTSLTEV